MKKKLLFLVSSMEGGGAERVAAMLCNHWSKSGFDVTLMATYSKRGICKHVLDDDVNLIFLADIVNSRTDSMYMKVRRTFYLRKYMIDEQPDIIVSFLTNVNIGAIIASFGLGIPVFSSERTYPPFNNWPILYNILRRIFYPYATSIIMQTQDGLDWLNKTISSATGAIIENPVTYPLPIPEIRSDNQITSQKIILCVARLSAEKNIDMIIRVFSELAHQYSDWDLVILGEGTERKKIEHAIGLTKLESRIHLVGRTNDPDFWYQQASLFIMYSKFEGFPNALVEAMSYGLPVISSNCKTGPQDIVNHLENGLLVELSNNREPLKEAMKYMIDNQQEARQMGERAIAVRELYKIEKVSLKWSDLFESK